MRVFLAGVSDVGKTAIGGCLAKRLGCVFYDLDREIEEHFHKPLEQLPNEALTPIGFRKQFASVVLAKLVQSERDLVMALFPSGLMDHMWHVLSDVDRVVIVLRDSPENIVSRITFYDTESNPIPKTLTDQERLYYLKEIRKDAAYFGRSFHRADMDVDITGLDVETSAAKIYRLLQERIGGRKRRHPVNCIEGKPEQSGGNQ